MTDLTLQDVYDRLDELGYSPTTYRDVRRDIARALQLHGVASLREIPADLDAFDALWRDRDDALVLGFSSPRAFRIWRTHVRGAIRRARGEAASASTTRDDAWRPILDYLTAEGSNRDKKMMVLAQRARRESLAPCDVDADWVAARHAALKSTHRSSLRQGVAVLNDLVERADEHPRIREVLPSAAIPLPETNARKRFGGLELPRGFHDDVERFLNHYRRGRNDLGDDEDEETAEEPSRREREYVCAISWLVRELVHAGELEAEEVTDLSAVVDVDLVRRAAKSFRDRREAGETKAEASTLYTYVGTIKAIAAIWIGASEEEIREYRKLMNKKSVKTKNVNGIAHDREQWLKQVVLSRDSTIRDTVLTMPDTLMRSADRDLARWSELSVSDRMRAIRAAAAACQTAIMLRTMALRKANVRGLRFRGRTPTLILPGRTRGARIEIPGAEVKNGRDLSGPVPQSAWPIVRRWLEVYRPLLVEHHPTGHNAVDSEYVFPSPSSDRPMSVNSMDRCFNHAVSMLGVGLTPHMTRHVVAAIILHRDPTKLEVVADFLGDTPATVKKNYTFLDTQRASEDAQSQLAKETTAARRRRRAA